MSDDGRTVYPYKAGYWSSHRQLPRLARQGERVLDVGCGEGHMAERALNAIQYALARCWNTLFAFQFILVAEPITFG